MLRWRLLLPLLELEWRGRANTQMLHQIRGVWQVQASRRHLQGVACLELAWREALLWLLHSAGRLHRAQWGQLLALRL